MSSKLENLYNQYGGDPRVVASLSEEDLLKAQKNLEPQWVSPHIQAMLDPMDPRSDPKVRAGYKALGEEKAKRMV